MACDIITARGAVFAVWGQPTVKDIDAVIEAGRATVSKFGIPVTYITRVPSTAPAPDPVVRRHLNEILPNTIHLCTSYHVVLEGEGFVAAFKRGVLVSLSQLTPRRSTFYVHSHVSEVVNCVNRSAQANVIGVLRLAASQGLLLTEMSARFSDDRPLRDSSARFRETAS